MSQSVDSFGSRSQLKSGNRTYEIFRLDALEKKGGPSPPALQPAHPAGKPASPRRRHNVTADDIEFLAKWDPKAEPSREIAYMPARVLMQDFTGVPGDRRSRRHARRHEDAGRRSRDASIRCSRPNWSSTTRSRSMSIGTAGRLRRQRAARVPAQPRALRLSQVGPDGLPQLLRRAAGHGHLPPGQSRIPGPRRLHHRSWTARRFAYPDTLVGTDSHTTMINGLGVLGWGVGGIEAEAAMLGQPVSMLIPQVVGFKLTGKLREGATATDLVLTVTQALRKLGVVGKFVEFYGPGIAELPLADRATIGNMAPEYGATCGIFPVDAETLRYLRLTGRSEEQIALVEAYYKEQGLFHTADSPEAEYTADASNWISPPSSPAWPDPSARRIACC